MDHDLGAGLTVGIAGQAAPRPCTLFHLHPVAVKHQRAPPSGVVATRFPCFLISPGHPMIIRPPRRRTVSPRPVCNGPWTPGIQNIRGPSVKRTLFEMEAFIMVINDYLRLISGTMVMLSVILANTVSPWFLLLTMFVGLNLFQSAFTRWCPMIALLRRAGVPD